MSKDYQSYHVSLGHANCHGDETRAQYFVITDGYPHPSFNWSLPWLLDLPQGADNSHDLLMLRLDRPALISRFVQVLSLPSLEPEIGSACYTSGWDNLKEASYHHQNTLRYMDLVVVPNENCAQSHAHKVTDSMLCTMSSVEDRPICVSNSGGPSHL
ncbi:kallikrein-1-like [Talpa occidentalis]|uniref:kallikrein-1-like n=1 Tax=Talpa occidentalis TaxID=50954 RepID=UPI00188EA51E|nr:kallikrein-1-like [Talpa occidentalis]